LGGAGSGGSNAFEAVKGAMILALEFCVIAEQEVERAMVIGEFGKRISGAVRSGAFGLAADLPVHNSFFVFPGTGYTPEGGGSDFGEFEFNDVSGLEGGEDFGVEFFEGFGAFAVKKDDLRAEAVPEGVHLASLLAFGSDGAQGFRAVGAGGEDFAFSSHLIFPGYSMERGRGVFGGGWV
jgi:hypothetical protein